MNIQNDIPSIPSDNFKDHYVLVFDLTPMQDATENCQYPELFGERLGLALNFTFPIEYVIELIVLGGWMSSVEVDKFGVFRKNIYKGKSFSPAKIQPYPAVQILYRGFFPCDFVPTRENDTFAKRKTQPSNMQGEHWIMLAKYRQISFLADSLGGKKYSFLQQHYQQILPEPLQSHPSVCCFYTINAVFHLFIFRQEEITGVHDINLLSFISKYM